MGYEPVERSVAAQGLIDLQEIIFTPASKKIEDVIVTAKPPLVTVNKTTLIVDVARTTLSSAGNVLDMLRRTPGIMRIGEDAITVIGRGAPLILIDGREVGTEYLKSMNAADIATLEIDQFPSSEYAANYKSVIRIKTKGLTSDNYYLRIGNALSVNSRVSTTPSMQFRIKKGIISSLLSYSYDNNNYKLNEQYFKYVTQPDDTFSSQSDNHIKGHSQTHRLLFANDFTLAKNHIMSFQYQMSLRDLFSDYVYENRIEEMAQSRLRDITQHNTQGKSTHSLSFMYKWDISESTDLSIISDYALVDALSTGHTNQYDHNFETLQIIDTRGKSDYSVYTAKAKSNIKLPREIMLGLGVSYASINNPSTVETQGLDDISSSQHLKLTEQVGAAYITLEKSWAKFALEAGGRYEYSQTKVLSATNRENDVDRHFSNLFPRLDLSYDFNEKNSLSLNYSSSISRPGYSELNPNIMYEDSYTYVRGNPYLKPAYTHDLSLSYNYKGFSISATYNNTHNEITHAVVSAGDDSNITFLMPINLSRSQSLGCNTSYNHNFKKFSFYISFGGTVPFVKVPYLDEIRRINRFSWDCSAVCEYTFSKHFAAYANFSYNSDNETLLDFQYATNSLDIGIRGLFCKRRMVIDLSGTDLLRGQNYNNINQKYLNVFSGTRGKGDFRGCTLRISYTFNGNRIAISSERGNREILDRTD